MEWSRGESNPGLGDANAALYQPSYGDKRACARRPSKPVYGRRASVPCRPHEAVAA